MKIIDSLTLLISRKVTVTTKLSQHPEEVFDKLIRLSEWWPEKFEGDPIQLNSVFVLRSGEGHYSKNAVTEFQRGKKLVWQTTESLRSADNFDWSGTKMIFELFPVNDHTLVKFTYDGVVRDDEQDRLESICDYCINVCLYNFIESYTTTIEVDHSAIEIFNCICNVANWWSRDFEGRSTGLNDEFVIHHPGRHYSRQKLTEIIPDKKIIWQVTESTLLWLLKDQHEWTGTKMIFEIESYGKENSVHFTHLGLTPFKECYKRCTDGWELVINKRLFDYISYGITI